MRKLVGMDGVEKRMKDTIFIKHIQSHLKDGEEVVCKICGKTAKEIISEELKVKKQ